MLKLSYITPVALALALSACGERKKKGATPQSQWLPTMPTQTELIPVIDSEPGTVVSDDCMDVSSRVVGFIQNLDVREGQKVSKDQVLVQIDPTNIHEAIRQAEAGVAAAHKDLADADHDVEMFTSGTAKGWATNETCRKAQVRRDIARTAVTRAEAALAAARSEQTYATLRSPFDGVVVRRFKHSGDMAVVGAPILSLESREALLFKVFVSESNVGRIARDMAASVRIDALPEKEIRGTVQRIVPSGDPVTRRFEVDILLPSEVDILPGMFGRAELVLGGSPALVIPKEALVERGGLEGSFVVDEKNVAHFRWLRLGREWNGSVEVTAGLSVGERIVSKVNGSVRDGIVIPTGDGSASHE